MNKFGPILVIMVSMLSIAFMGFAGVATFGGPNWRAMADLMTEYQFSRDGEQWSAVSASNETLKSSAVLPEVIVAALDDKAAKLKVELDTLKASEPLVLQNLETITTQIQADKQGLVESLEQKQQLLAQLSEEYGNLSRQVVQKTEDGSGVEKDVSDRRSDVFRLQNQLAVLRADQARIDQVHQQMTDLIEQIDADLDKARRRERQLRQRLGQDY